MQGGSRSLPAFLLSGYHQLDDLVFFLSALVSTKPDPNPTLSGDTDSITVAPTSVSPHFLFMCFF